MLQEYIKIIYEKNLQLIAYLLWNSDCFLTKIKNKAWMSGYTHLINMELDIQGSLICFFPYL